MDLININQLEFITKLGREEETVELMGTKFTFKTLSVDDNTHAFENPTKEQYQDDIAKFNAFRIEVLSRALLKINDMVIPEKMRPQLRDTLKRSQQMALNKLFDAYGELIQKQENKFTAAEAGLAAQVPGETASTVAMKEPAKPVVRPVEQKPVEQKPEPPADAPINILNPVNPSNLMGPKK